MIVFVILGFKSLVIVIVRIIFGKDIIILVSFIIRVLIILLKYLVSKFKIVLRVKIVLISINVIKREYFVL